MTSRKEPPSPPWSGDKDDITEQLPAPPDTPVVHPIDADVAKRRETTRTILAASMVALLGMMAATACAGWLFQDADTNAMQALAVAVAPVTTLAATVLGYYFLSEK